MDPNLDMPSGLPLPDAMPGPAGVGQPYAAQPATATAHPSGSPPLNQTTPSLPSPPQLMVPIADAPPPGPTTMPTGTQGPAVAADDDLIEKAWVERAKQIVANTRQDPYQQNKQLAALKAEYIQKRYNKTIKLSE